VPGGRPEAACSGSDRCRRAADITRGLGTRDNFADRGHRQCVRVGLDDALDRRAPLGGIGGGKGKDADLLQHSVDAMSVNIGGRSAYGASISIEGQLNFLADWSSSARNRIDLSLQLDYLDPKRIGYGIQVSQTLYPSSHVLYDRPYEVVIDSNEMNYAVDLGTMIKNGYYWDKASDNKFAVLTYCQTQYMSTGEILKGCDMTAHAP
jgi:hypothetical protein